MKKLLFIISFAAAAITAAKAVSPEQKIALLEARLVSRERQVNELSAKLTEKENELRKLRVWMAAVAADGRITEVSERELRLLTALKNLLDYTGKLILKSAAFADLIRPRLAELPLSSADRVRLTMALEGLERSAARASTAADAAKVKDSMLQNIRVIAVRPELEMAVISAGSLHGVFPGMTFTAADGKIRLRVMETRPAVSGVIAVAGSLDALVPGSEVKLMISKSK